MSESPGLMLGRVRAILDAFSLPEPVRTASQIARATGLPSSTTHRLVGQLVEHGLLDRDGDGYRIGALVAYWAGPAVVGRDLTAVLNPQLEALRVETGETACFFRPEGESRVCIAVAETHHGLRREMYVGRIQPLHVGSAGRVILAWRPDLLERITAAPLEAMTEATVTDATRLRDLVSETHAEGYAITVGERVEAASGLSAPVFDAHGVLTGALTLMGPTLRMPREQCEAYVDAVVSAADRTTAAIGGRRP